MEGHNSIIKELGISLFVIVIVMLSLYLLTFFPFNKEKEKENKKCSSLDLISCGTKEICGNNNFYWWNDRCNLVLEPEIKPSEYPDYDLYKELNKIILASSTDSWVIDPDNNKVQGRVITKFIKVDGNISNGYLYVDVSVDNNKPFTVWDSIYVSLNKLENNYSYKPILDGHLLRSKSIKVPDSNTTVLLYDLKQIPFTVIPYSEDNKYKNLNWLDLIKKSKEFQFVAFISTLRNGGHINNISIGYECADSTPNCKLSIVEQIIEQD